MNYQQTYFMEILSSAVMQKKLVPPTQTVNWKEIFDKSVTQNICGIMYSVDGLSELKNDENTDLFNTWEQAMYQTMIFFNKRIHSAYNMLGELVKNDIDVIAQKGIAVRELYPVPELRTMGDIDILIQSSDKDKVNKIFLENGYTIGGNSINCRVMSKENELSFEVFTDLEQDIHSQSAKIIAEMFDTKIPWHNGLFTADYTLSLFHLLAHTGKHFLKNGAGVRNLCDIVLFMKAYGSEIDYDKVKTLCNDVDEQLLKFAEVTFSAVEKYFGVQNPWNAVCTDNQIDLYIEYMLLNGVFGKHDSVLYFQMSKKTDTSRIRRLLFPPAEDLDYRYTYLRKHKWMLPIAWVHRVINVKRDGRSYTKLIGEVNDCTNADKIKNDYLKEIGII